MTEDTSETTDRKTMADVDHTNPYTGRPFGSACAFERGPTVAADGGKRDAADDRAPTDDPAAVDDPAATDDDPAAVEDPSTMADVDHEHPHGSDATKRTFERGNEGRDDTV